MPPSPEEALLHDPAGAPSTDTALSSQTSQEGQSDEDALRADIALRTAVVAPIRAKGNAGTTDPLLQEAGVAATWLVPKPSPPPPSLHSLFADPAASSVGAGPLGSP